MEEASNVFISIQSFKDFVLEHGKLYREVWKRRHSDGKPYRMVLFEDSCEAIAIHQLDRYSFEELTNLSSLRVGHFIGGGYAVFLTWVTPSEWEDIELKLDEDYRKEVSKHDINLFNKDNLFDFETDSDCWSDENGIPYIIDYIPSSNGDNEIISEENQINDEEAYDSWTDEYGVEYSLDRKRLLEAPEEIQNYAILDGTEEICDAAFTRFCGFDEDTSVEYWFGKLTSIKIPNSVTVIGSQAFRGCYDLKSIVIPGNVKEIGESAFRECEGLTSLTLNRGLLTIRRNAFGGCKDLEEIYIPDTVLKIEEYAFTGCSGLKSIKVEQANSYYDSRNNCNAIIDTRRNSLVAGCYQTIIPDSIVEIGSLAFENCYGLNSISIPYGVRKIGSFAFHGCKGLTSISLPDSITDIGYCAFAFCESLESIIIPEGVTEICFKTFEGCSSLKCVTLPDSIKDVGPDAFSGCARLESIIIPLGTKQIFEQLLPKVKGLLVYDNQQATGHNNQTGNTWTDEHGVKYDREKKILLKAPKEIEKYVVVDGTKAIGNAAFSNCEELKAVILPDSIIEIGHYAFAGCKSINSFAIPNRVMRLGTGVFMNCCELSVIRIPAGLNEIESNIFQGCEELHHVFVPEGGKYKYDKLLYGHDVSTYEYNPQSKDEVEQLDGYLHGIKDKFGVVYDFKEELLLHITKNLTVYSVKHGTIGIKSNAFQIKELGGDNKSLKRLYLPDSIMIIGGGAFAYNENLEYINIPRYATFHIEKNPFAGCFNLHTIKWESQITIKEGTLILNKEKKALIACLPWHYVEGIQKFWPLLDFARNHGRMKINSHIYYDPEFGEEVTEKSCVFIHPTEKDEQGRNVVTYVSFGTKLGVLSSKEIVAQKEELKVAQLDSGDYILCRREHAIIEPENCVTLHEGVESIASKAFYGNNQLKKITLPKSLKVIGEGAFKDCHSLKEIQVPCGTLDKYKALLPDLADIIAEVKSFDDDLPF